MKRKVNAIWEGDGKDGKGKSAPKPGFVYVPTEPNLLHTSGLV